MCGHLVYMKDIWIPKKTFFVQLSSGKRPNYAQSVVHSDTSRSWREVLCVGAMWPCHWVQIHLIKHCGTCTMCQSASVRGLGGVMGCQAGPGCHGLPAATSIYSIKVAHKPSVLVWSRPSPILFILSTLLWVRPPKKLALPSSSTIGPNHLTHAIETLKTSLTAGVTCT